MNFAKSNLTAAFLEAQAIVNAFASPVIASAGILLDAIEIGNEADFYRMNGRRPKSFTPTQYVMECVILFSHLILLTACRFVRWTEFAQNLSVLSPPGFWGGSFAQSSHSSIGFSPQAIIEEGILSSPPGSMISTYACFLTQPIHPDEFVRCIGFHNTTIVETFARGKVHLCKI